LWENRAVGEASAGAQVILDGGPILLLDGKGRLTIPTRYRDALRTLCGDQLSITKSFRRCLTIFPRPAWEALRDKLLATPMGNDDVRRLFVGSVSHVEIDNASRVLIAPELREWASIERDVVLAGMGSRFELWDKARLDAHEATVFAGGIPESMRDLVL
jgi:MraZ protein